MVFLRGLDLLVVYFFGLLHGEIVSMVSDYLDIFQFRIALDRFLYLLENIFGVYMAYDLLTGPKFIDETFNEVVSPRLTEFA